MAERQEGDAQSGPELVIGLIGPVGVDLQVAVEGITAALASCGYGATAIRLSAAMHRCAGLALPSPSAPEAVRVAGYMEAGNRVRRLIGSGAGVALLGLLSLRDARAAADPSGGQKPRMRHAYVINSLKHRDELKLLREIYGPAFIALSMVAPLWQRRQALAARMARQRGGSASAPDAAAFADADALIERDAKEPGDAFGQDVRATFPQADAFIDVSAPSSMAAPLARVLRLVLGDPFVTPTEAEFGMFQARAAALRSADLSRQVGAAILGRGGSLIAVGCNEVPRVGGGAPWEGDVDAALFDRRDFRLGYDSTAQMKQKLTAEVLEALGRAGWLAPGLMEARGGALALALSALYGDAAPLRETRLASLLEFGRMVHAEMSALSDAARRGIAVDGATLYCTTFPCHVCARHLIATGIARVIYIEPYPKSLARELYAGMLVTEADPPEAGPVASLPFDPYLGVAPRRFQEWFDYREREDRQGRAIVWEASAALPRVPAAIHDHAERAALAALQGPAAELGLVLPAL